MSEGLPTGAPQCLHLMNAHWPWHSCPTCLHFKTESRHHLAGTRRTHLKPRNRGVRRGCRPVLQQAMDGLLSVTQLRGRHARASKAVQQQPPFHAAHNRQSAHRQAGLLSRSLQQRLHKR